MIDHQVLKISKLWSTLRAKTPMDQRVYVRVHETAWSDPNWVPRRLGRSSENINTRNREMMTKDIPIFYMLK